MYGHDKHISGGVNIGTLSSCQIGKFPNKIYNYPRITNEKLSPNINVPPDHMVLQTSWSKELLLGEILISRHTLYVELLFFNSTGN